MTIVILEQSARMDLQGEARAVAEPLSDPACVTRTLPVEMKGLFKSRTGIWEVTAGRFRRELANAEVMHILSGACTFTTDDGETREIHAGDTLFFPANTNGVWDIHAPLRKVYAVLG
jgi:uncharacterized protein